MSSKDERRDRDRDSRSYRYRKSRESTRDDYERRIHTSPRHRRRRSNSSSYQRSKSRVRRRSRSRSHTSRNYSRTPDRGSATHSKRSRRPRSHSGSPKPSSQSSRSKTDGNSKSRDLNKRHDIIVIPREESRSEQRMKENQSDSKFSKVLSHRGLEFMSSYENKRIDIPDDLDPINKEKIHKEIEGKLREALAREGKVYPPPKTEASHPIFANDGSFLETFKKMQQQMLQVKQQANAPKNLQPINRRRGGKILKTGVVAKTKILDGTSSTETNDVWSIYLNEIKKYRNASCDVDINTRSLVK